MRCFDVCRIVKQKESASNRGAAAPLTLRLPAREEHVTSMTTKDSDATASAGPPPKKPEPSSQPTIKSRYSLNDSQRRDKARFHDKEREQAKKVAKQRKEEERKV